MPQLINNRYYLIGETDNLCAREEFYKKLDLLVTEIKFEKNILLLPDDVMAGTICAIPVNSIANLRHSPAMEAEMVSQTLRGLSLDILKYEDGFYFVRTDDGYLGWVAEDQIIVGDMSFKDDWQSSPQVVFIDLEGTVYSRPSLNAYPVSDVVMGNRFKLIERKRKWTQVEFPDGREGFIPTKSLEDLDTYSNRALDYNQLVKTARQFVGRPYTWGAASPKQMDCSGFTQTVFRQHGFLLQRDASLQVKQGTPVDTTDFPSRLAVGDLVFFSPNVDRISHVGIYLGDNQFIHASGRVKIDSFNPNDENYNAYRRHTVRAVRRNSK